jgi:DNA-directed RNA polymerase specialized sigma subunit
MEQDQQPAPEAGHASPQGSPEKASLSKSEPEKGKSRKKGGFPWATAIRRYQEVLFAEKLALVQVPAARRHLQEYILTLHEPSKQRRVSASEVVALISRASSRKGPLDAAFVRELDRIGFTLLWWNQLRECAEKDHGSQAQAWQAKSNELAQVAEPLIQEGFKLVERILAQLYSGPMRDNARALGIVGLYRALERFDTSRGTHFPSYAAFWIRNELLRELSQRKVVRESEYSRKLRLRRRKERLQEGRPEEQEEPSPTIISLDEVVKTDEEGSTLHELLPDESASLCVEDREAVAREWVRILQEAPLRYRMVLALRYFYPAWELEPMEPIEFLEVQHRLTALAQERLFVGVSKALAATVLAQEASHPKHRERQRRLFEGSWLLLRAKEQAKSPKEEASDLGKKLPFLEASCAKKSP